MYLTELVTAADAVAGTRSRRRKVTLLADLLRRLGADEVGIGVGYVAGEPRQHRLGIGWRTLHAIDPPPSAQPVLSLVDVDVALDRLAALQGPGSRTARLDVLAALLGRCTAAEQRFVRRLVLGELRQGALAGVASQAIAEAYELDETVVRRATMLAGDLAAVAEAAARGGTVALTAFGLELFRPLQPMLAQTTDRLADALDGPALVERKLDGARIQVHRRGDEVRVYTRSLRDVTADHPTAVRVVGQLAARCLVLDGEALAMRPDGRPEAFQDSMRRGSALSPFFFDLLHVDGDDLLDAPAADRRAALERIVPAEHRVPGRVVAGLADAEAVLAEALRAGHEGVVVKDLRAPYEAGRRGASWRKYKPVHTLDLVVLAVEWGSGRRRGWLSNLHLGARDGEGGFVMLGKTFKGLTDELLAWQTRELLARETRREGHVVHVRPELVVEVAFDGVQASSRYPGGLALRFARVRRYRDDKTPDEADTIDAVRALHPRSRF